jgi:hypothetical protein
MTMTDEWPELLVELAERQNERTQQLQLRINSQQAEINELLFRLEALESFLEPQRKIR